MTTIRRSCSRVLAVLWCCFLLPLSSFAQAPAILNQPTYTSAVSGSDTVFSVAASGSAPLSYRWRLFGTNLPGRTNATLTVTNVQPALGGLYSVVVSNASGAVTSAPAFLAVDEQLTFRVLQLQTNGLMAVEHNGPTGDDRGGLVVTPGYVFVTGDSATARFSATDLTGAIGLGRVYDGLCSNLRDESIYVLGNGATIVDNSGGPVTSLLQLDAETGLPNGVRINLSTNIPSSQFGSPGIFSGYDRIVIWNGRDVYDIALPSGKVTVAGQLPNFAHTFTENWAFWGWAEYFNNTLNLCYVSVSAIWRRPVAPNSVATVLQQFSNLADMASIGFSRSRSRWYFHHEGTSQFRSGDETLGSAKATYSTNGGVPFIYQHPLPQIAFPGDTLTLSAAASGPEPLTYQWRVNGTNINSATDAILVLTNLPPSATGNYSVQVSSATAAATSSNAFVMVVSAPQILVHPQPTSASAGTNALFNVVFLAAPPVFFQWRHNGTNIPNATNATHNIPAVTTAHIGGYSVVITNRYGSVTSSVAALTLIVEAAYSFKILALSNDAVVAEHLNVTGDDRGGIAVSSNRIFVAGDTAVGLFSANDLSGGIPLATFYDALITDLRTAKIYSLGRGTNLFQPGLGASTNVTTLIEINGDTGARTTNVITLSAPIPIFGEAGLFAGYGQVVIHNGTRVYSIAIPSGVVADLGEMFAPQHQTTENWAYWGLAENFGGSVYLVYAENFISIVRTRVPDGITTTIANFLNLSDMASISASVSRGRWYFHHEGSSQFGGTNETVGFASAVFSIAANPIVDHFSWEPLPGAQFSGVPFNATITARNIEDEVVSNFSGSVSFSAFATINGAPVNVTPATSARFTNGTWAGQLVVTEPSPGVFIRATDFAGRFGVSSPFSVVTTNDLAVQLVPSTNAATLYAALTYHVLVTNSGPQVSSAVFATNILPPNVDFISATSSQGSCNMNNGVVVCGIGTMASGSSVLIDVMVVPNTLGTLTNRVEVVRSAPEAHPENNSAVAITTVSMPAIIFNDPSSLEGNSVTSRGTNVFFIQLNTTSAVPVSVRYTTAPGTATNIGDYVTRSGLIVFAPGVTSTNINITLGGEQNFELNESFFMNFSSVTNAILVRTQAIGTIINDDAAPGIVVADESLNEGNSGTTALTFPVRLSVPASVPITVNYTTSNGTAIAGSDYVARSGSLVYVPGSGANSTNLFLTLNITPDTFGESNEFFYVNFSATNINASAQMVVVINNDDPANVLDHFAWSSIAPTQVLNTPFDATLSARDAVDRPLSNYNGTVKLNAGAGATGTEKILGDVAAVDFFNGGLFTIGFAFTPNTTLFITHVRHYSGTKVSIWTDTGTLVVSRAVSSINGRWVDTPLAVPVRLDAGTTYRLGGFNGTDTNPWYFGSVLPSVFEHGTIGNGYYADGDGFPTFDLGNSLYLVDLAYTLNLFTFSMAPTNVIFTNGTWGGSVRVLTPGEGVQLFATTANNLVSSASNPFDVLLADDLALTVTPSANPVPTGENLVYSITVSNAGPTSSHSVFLTNVIPANAIYVSSSNDHGSISAGGGAVIANIGTLTNGEVASLRIVIRANAAGSLSNFTFVGRSTPEPYVANNSVITFVEATPLTLAINDTFVFEGQSGATNVVFRVGLSAVSTQTVSVAYGTGGSLSDSTPGVDYQPTNGVIVFAPGVTERFVSVPVFGDVANEADEFFFLILTNAAGATVDVDSAAGYIVNDDPLPMISVADIAVAEGRNGFTPATFTLRLAPASGFTVDVNFETADGSATTNDYAPTNFFVTFLPGQTTAQVTVPVRGDGAVEPDEFFLFNLSFPANATLATAQARGTIINDDSGAGGVLSYFEWSAVPSPQTIQRGIDVTITARDGLDAIFPFSGTVSLAALQGTNVVLLAPTNSAAFVNGAWSGTLTLFSPATNVVLVANDGAGHIGLTDPFDVNVANIGLGVSAPPQVLIDSPFNYTLGVTNFGPNAATSVSLSNVVPADASFVSASSSGGGCSYANGILTCDISALPDGGLAFITVRLNPLRGGPLTAVFRASAFEHDPALSNNAVTNITVITGDEDHDALPDAWETDHGLSSANPNDANIDSDGDGHTNLQEYIAGTDPTVPASVLKVAVSVEGGSAQIHFSTVAGKRYALENAPAPNGPWTMMGNEMIGDGDLAIIFDPNPPVAAQRFYRLRVLR